MNTLLLNLLLIFGALTGHTPGGRSVGERELVLVLEHVVGNEKLVLGNACVNILGDTITVQKFKYYLSHFSVTDDQGKTTMMPPSYFLVDEADASSKTIRLMVPDAKISSIRFMIGVDSTMNVSGIQQGALDPLKGMFWTWNTGYIMAKLEGSSPSSKIAGHAFTYHVGGYRQPYSTMRWVELGIPGKDTVHIKADINHWFKAGSELSIAVTPVCHSTGAMAARIADNFGTMFSVATAP
jgi:hypothetical protein